MIPFTRTLSVPQGSASQPAAALSRVASGAALGVPRVLLRAEGLLVLVAAVLAYRHLGARWSLFASLFLAPDLSMLGYLAGPRAGAIAYDAVHTYLAPGLLALLGTVVPAVLPLALIWISHLGLDRLLGYGLKYSTAFGDTHLGTRGKA